MHKISIILVCLISILLCDINHTVELKKEDKINHISTAGGALVLYLTGEKLPMIKSLEEAAIKHRSK